MTKTVSLFRIFFVALMMCATTLLGQSVNEITVTGKVIDDKGETVIGASILVKGTGTGVITDIDVCLFRSSSIGISDPSVGFTNAPGICSSSFKLMNTSIAVRQLNRPAVTNTGLWYGNGILQRITTMRTGWSLVRYIMIAFRTFYECHLITVLLFLIFPIHKYFLNL